MSPDNAQTLVDLRGILRHLVLIHDAGMLALVVLATLGFALAIISFTAWRAQ